MPAVAIAERLDAEPHDLARAHQHIEVGGTIALHAGRQHVGFEHRCRQRRALQLLDRVEQRVEAAARPHHALPHRRQPPQRVGLDRLDLAPQPRERSLAQRAEHARTRTTRGACRRA